LVVALRRLKSLDHPTVREHLALFVGLEAEALMLPGQARADAAEQLQQDVGWPHAV